MANRYTIKLYGKRRGWVAKVWRSATKIIQWFIRDTIVSRICRTETFSSPSILFFPQRVKTTKQRWKRLISSSRKRKGGRRKKRKKKRQKRDENERKLEREEKKKETKRKRRDYHHGLIKISPLFVSNFSLVDRSNFRGYPLQVLNELLQVKFRTTRVNVNFCHNVTVSPVMIHHTSPAFSLCHANCTLLRIYIHTYIYVYVANGRKWETRERWWSLSRLFKNKFLILSSPSRGIKKKRKIAKRLLLYFERRIERSEFYEELVEVLFDRSRSWNEKMAIEKKNGCHGWWWPYRLRGRIFLRGEKKKKKRRKEGRSISLELQKFGILRKKIHRSINQVYKKRKFLLKSVSVLIWTKKVPFDA